MAWGKCPTHGPIQDAHASVRGDVTLLWCRCGLECAAFTPHPFVEHSDLVELAASGRQPKADHESPNSPEPTGSIEDYHQGGGMYLLPNGERVKGKAAALVAFDSFVDESGFDTDGE